MPQTLNDDEVCRYFEALPEGRRELVWVRCERQLGCPIDELDPNDPQIDEAFHQVLTDMWVVDQLERLTELGRLERFVGEDGRIRYLSA